MTPIVHVVIAEKMSDAREVVFAVFGDIRDASLVVERLRGFGLTARIERAREGSVWPGASWPMRERVSS